MINQTLLVSVYHPLPKVDYTTQFVVLAVFAGVTPRASLAINCFL